VTCVFEKATLDIKVVFDKNKKIAGQFFVPPRSSAEYNPPEYVEKKRFLGAGADYWIDLQGYYPSEAAKSIDRPLLILQGGRDYQVTVKDFDGWKKALSGKDNVEFKLYPAHNHLLIPGKGKCTPAEYQIAGHVDREVIEDIAAWIKKAKKS
jgi:fermentation-respiration switch protein FrsA (DUF1100 family)